MQFQYTIAQLLIADFNAPASARMFVCITSDCGKRVLVSQGSMLHGDKASHISFMWSSESQQNLLLNDLVAVTSPCKPSSAASGN